MCAGGVWSVLESIQRSETSSVRKGSANISVFLVTFFSKKVTNNNILIIF